MSYIVKGKTMREDRNGNSKPEERLEEQMEMLD